MASEDLEGARVRHRLWCVAKRRIRMSVFYPYRCAQRIDAAVPKELLMIRAGQWTNVPVRLYGSLHNLYPARHRS